MDHQKAGCISRCPQTDCEHLIEQSSSSADHCSSSHAKSDTESGSGKVFHIKSYSLNSQSANESDSDKQREDKADKTEKEMKNLKDVRAQGEKFQGISRDIVERTEDLNSVPLLSSNRGQSDATQEDKCKSTVQSSCESLNLNCSWSIDFDEFPCSGDLSDNELLSAAESLESCEAEQTKEKNEDVHLADNVKEKVFMFGLLGTDSDEDAIDDQDKVNLFCRLPDEVVENIFCQLPMMDLLLNCALVCHHWKSIISSEKFIPWKKRYHKLKKENRETQDSVIKILDDNGLYEEELFPYYLARFMEDFKRVNSVSVSFLKEHSKFPLIQKFLTSFFSTTEKEPSPWSVVALLVLVSSTVNDVNDVISCMEKSNLCLVHDVLECLYCLATIFFALQIQNRISPGLHYRTFYALYLYENSPSHAILAIDENFDSTDNGSGSFSENQITSNRCFSGESINLTHEQNRIVKHTISPGETIKIVAFAGTGKTTTLAKLAERNSTMSFLNLSYNSSVQQHAERTFPLNVTCKTTHAWAYKYMRRRYSHKLECGTFSTGKISNVLPECHFLHARRVEKTLSNFMASSDPYVSDRHVPPLETVEEDGDGHGADDLDFYNSEEYIRKVVHDTKYIWRRMKNPQDEDVGITHDGYLKVYQLSKPSITDFDCLLIDEAQDCTPAVTDIFLRQNCSKVLVGDPNQQIYGFRGARNAMREARASHTFFLTQSFRFGPDIAYVAATLLHALIGETRNTLVGNNKDSGIFGDQVGQLAIITRCNYTLFNEASKMACENNNLKIAFAGGLEKFGLDRILDIHKLFTAHGVPTVSLGIKDKFIKRFKNFKTFKAYAKKARDVDILGKIKIVETHHVRLPERVKKIKSKNTPHQEQADVVFSTVHKAKGLEFDTVRVTDDFLLDDESATENNERRKTGGRGEEECNLLYVAVTRAKKRLQLTQFLLNVLASKKEFSLRAISLEKALQIGTTCISCKVKLDFNVSNEPYVVMERPKIKLGTGAEIVGGIVCPSCALRNVRYLGCMVSREHQPLT